MLKQRVRLAKRAALALLVVGALTLSGCQPLPQAALASPTVIEAAPLPRTITVVGEGTVKIKPDLATTTLGVQITGTSAKEATATAGRTLETILAALRKQGIAEKDIQTTGLNVWGDRERSPEGRAEDKITYYVNNNVTVVVRDLSKVGAVVDAAIEAGANAIHGVSFSVAEPKKLVSEARNKAASDARTRAEELAKLHGETLGEVASISEVVSGNGVRLSNDFRVEMAAKSAALGSGIGSISPGELELGLQLQVSYLIK